ncbi:TIGR02234 family membrane protein [Mycolicibacterium moriokaense]|uniref:Putative membrane protein (TIGR02234 family) n=1 Tax=Mycolicibacterium moriokaense TaxID=39691 RepID=A0A318HJC5_9MYCO|nr:TIGR02234 family membrane protein [Mycolicibacterium moriokaense]PXX09955.1 putative membrane protein (TIGR02234 family) [Mycolicibacterium moriokaense]
MIRFAPLLLVLSAAALWGASRMVWVDVQSFDGLGQPKASALTGGTWSTALVPLAAILLVAAIAPIALRGWRLGVLAVVIAALSAVMGYLAISLWVIRDVAVRAVHLAGVPAADLVGTQRHYGGAILTLVAAMGTLVGAALLLRSVAKPRPEVDRYERRKSAQSPQDDADTSERVIWDALDEGRDPTDPDNKGR